LKGASRELSDKEKAWVQEIKTLESKILRPVGESDSSRSSGKEPWERYEEIKRLKEDLLQEFNQLIVEEDSSTRTSVKVPSEIRKAKVAQIMGLLDRETALVEGAKSRLERLSLS
jgi:nucleoporin NUP82